MNARRKRHATSKLFLELMRIMRHSQILLFFLGLWFAELAVHSFVFSSRSALLHDTEQNHNLHAYPIEKIMEESQVLANNETESGAALLGAALMRLREEEEDFIRDDRNFFDDKNVSSSDRGLQAVKVNHTADGFMSMDAAAATELDNSVTKVSDRNQLKKTMTVLPSSPFYARQVSTSENGSEQENLSLPPWSQPSHYQERIDRDKRLLAIGIAESVVHPWQWTQFKEEKGGIQSLLKSISVGAAAVKKRKSRGKSSKAGMSQNEQQQRYNSFLAACHACRALRDLCAISDEIRAVMTNEILRADAALSGSLMDDLTSLLKHANEEKEPSFKQTNIRNRLLSMKSRRESRKRCKLYVLQMLLAMAIASDDAIDTFRAKAGLKEAVLAVSSYDLTQKTRRWIRYPGELWKKYRFGSKHKSRPFIEAASVRDGLSGQVQGTANQLLAAIGYNQWVPKIPGQKGLRILCFDGGGTRGMSAISSLRSLTEAMGGEEVCDAFDIICGTSTGAIIAFLVGLRRETSQTANDRYDILIERIFGKTVPFYSTLFTTAKYSEEPFVEVLNDILGDSIMLDSRADPAVPLVFGVSSVMTSTPTYATLFRNYNYACKELPDPFVLDPDEARQTFGLQPEFPSEVNKSEWRRNFDLKSFITGTKLSKEGSRYFGSFRPLQREALRKSTAAPTIFKPVKVKDVVYTDGGIVASNPTSIAIHEAKTLFPNVPIEMVVSIGTGGFTEDRFSLTEKRFSADGWNAIIGQIVNSACDAERIHHVIEDMSGACGGGMKYYRFNPVIGGTNDFPIDAKDPELLAKLYNLTKSYLEEPEQQVKLKEIRNTLNGKRGWKRLLSW